MIFINLTVYLVLLVLLSSSVYFYLQIQKLKKNIASLKTIEQCGLSGNLYNILSENIYTRKFIISMEQDYNLIASHEILSKVYSTTTLVVSLSGMFLLFIFLSRYSFHWYQFVYAVFISIILPPLITRSVIDSKVLKIRLALCPAYETFAASYTSSPKTEEAIRSVILNSSFRVRPLFRQFENEYLMDANLAFNNFKLRVGDSYADSFCTILKAYESDGANPISSVNRVANMARRKYLNSAKFHKGLSMYKVLGVVLFFVTVIMVLLIQALMGSMGNDVTASVTFNNMYNAILVLECVYMIICFIFESL